MNVWLAQLKVKWNQNLLKTSVGCFYPLLDSDWFEDGRASGCEFIHQHFRVRCIERKLYFLQGVQMTNVWTTPPPQIIRGINHLTQTKTDMSFGWRKVWSEAPFTALNMVWTKVRKPPKLGSFFVYLFWEKDLHLELNNSILLLNSSNACLNFIGPKG